jgi:hypothetical protein
VDALRRLCVHSRSYVAHTSDWMEKLGCCGRHCCSWRTCPVSCHNPTRTLLLTTTSIYGIRYALTSYFDYRITNTEKYLKKLNKDRDATIERLKESTKYNSTQQLLEKYGASPKEKAQAPSTGKKQSQGPQKPAQAPGPRTGIAPPPTANIQRPGQQQQPITPQRAPLNASALQELPPQQPPPDSPGAEFAPNAFGAAELTKQFSAAPATTFTQTHWYDRILDALLGEDETQSKNRLALICSECRLVNGQAPPGARSLEDVGRWRCSSCHAWNGEEKPHEDVAVLVKGWEAERKAKERQLGGSRHGAIDDDNRETDDGGFRMGADESEEMDGEEEEVEEVTRPLGKSTRSKSKKGRK